jgi:hypothetical protein
MPARNANLSTHAIQNWISLFRARLRSRNPVTATSCIVARVVTKAFQNCETCVTAKDKRPVRDRIVQRTGGIRMNAKLSRFDTAFEG